MVNKVFNNSIHKNYKFDIPDYVQYVINILESHDHEVYVVGGSIRDKILGKSEDEIHDYDLVTNCDPRYTYKIFVDLDGDKYDIKVTTTGMIHNTLKIWIDNNEPIDVTMYGNSPMFVNSDVAELNKGYDPTIYDDLSRRDFTMNALAYNPNVGLVDVYNGVRDIKHRNLKFIGPVSSRINNDPFLILRAIRQSITLQFSMDYTTQSVIFDSDYYKLVKNVSGWRRGNELRKILSFKSLNSLSEEYLAKFCNNIVKYMFNDDYIQDNIEFRFDNRLIKLRTFEDRISYLLRNIPLRILRKILIQEFEYELSLVDLIMNISWRYHSNEES